MPASTAGASPATGNTARPAEKGTNTEGPDAALVRRTIDALVALSTADGKPMRRKAARQVVLGYTDRNGGSLDGWALWLRSWHGYADPTGETARRRADRDRGLAERLQRAHALRGGGAHA